MKILLKILVAPFALALSLLTALLVFLFDICAFLLTIASVILAVLGIALFFTPPPSAGLYFCSSPSSFRRMGCKRWLVLCFGLWTEASLLCIDFWQVDFGSAWPEAGKGGLKPPFPALFYIYIRKRLRGKCDIVI